MPDATPNPELLRSLGRLARGLSALFWGLPAALLSCGFTFRAERVQFAGIIPAIVTLSLLYYGLWLMGDFQKQERPWTRALDRARLPALINLGSCPFLLWWNHFPQQPYFIAGVGVLAFSGVIFLFNLNLVIARLGAMLPDETLRQETRSFTVMNRLLLVGLVLSVGVYFCLWRMPDLPPQIAVIIEILSDTNYKFWLLVFLFLLPLAMTMALLWKTKEVILESVFGGRG
jgi:hypothetical protein